MATTVDRRTWLLEVADDRRGPQQLQAMLASSTSYNFVSCLRVQIMGGAALSNPVVRAACMHRLGNLGKGQVDLLPRLSSSLVANAIPCLAAYQVSIERGARRTACQCLARLQTEMKTRHKAVVSGLTFASACSKA